MTFSTGKDALEGFKANLLRISGRSKYSKDGNTPWPKSCDCQWTLCAGHGHVYSAENLACLSQATRQLEALWQNKMNPIPPTLHNDFTIRSRTQDHCVIESGDPFKKQIAGTSGTGAVQILTLHFYCHDASLDSKYWGP